MDERDQEELEWRKWRAELKFVPVIVDGHEVTIDHGGKTRPVRLIALLAGSRGWYVECQCHTAGERRTFAVDNIGSITTEDGVKFEHFHDWMLHRATIAPAVADEMGIIQPPKSERR